MFNVYIFIYMQIYINRHMYIRSDNKNSSNDNNNSRIAALMFIYRTCNFREKRNKEQERVYVCARRKKIERKGEREKVGVELK